MNVPNCSAKANSTSSSSYMVSVKNGISSVRVLSSPSAKAMVDSFLIEFNRNCNVKIIISQPMRSRFH